MDARPARINNGADLVLNPMETDVSARIKELTDGYDRL